MKKTCFRITILLLILAIVVSMMPMVLAEETSFGDSSQTGDEAQKPELVGIKISVPAGTIYTGSTVTLTVKADPAGADLPAGTVTWSTNAPNGVLDTSKAGTVTVTASLGGHSDEVQLTVKDKLVIECNDATAGVGETVYLEPVLKLNDKTVSSIDSVITAASTDFDADEHNDYIVVRQKYYTAETGKVTIFASTTGTDGEKIETSKTVDVTFYEIPSLKITLRNGVSNFYFSDDDVVEYYSVGSGANRSGSGYSVGELIEYNMDNADAAYYGFEMGSSSGGSLECASASSNGGYDLRVSIRNLYNVRFIQQSMTNKTTNFEVYALSSSNKVLSVLYVTLTAGNAVSDIEYSTIANRAVTFNARDFYNCWDDIGTSGSLSYVKFGSPTSGALYTDSARKTRVTSSMNFYYGSGSTYNYSLDNVTYMPTTSTAQYTVEIPFMAYGIDSKAVSGAVVIKVNGEPYLITTRGINLVNYQDRIAGDYYKATRRNLGYVVFELPDSKIGTLYSSIDVNNEWGIITDAVPLEENTMLSYSSYFGGIYFIPAPGTLGAVAFTYTAYDANGENAYQGSLQFYIEMATSAIYMEENLQVTAGETLEVPVMINYNNPGFSSFAFAHSYDTKVFTLKEVRRDSMLGLDKGTFINDGNTVVWMNSKNATGGRGGILYTLVFEVKEDAPIGTYTISTALAQGLATNFMDEYGNALPVTFAPTTVKVDVRDEYRINSIVVTDTAGTTLKAIPVGTSLATVSVTNLKSKADTLVFFAAYSADGQYQGLVWVGVEGQSVGSTFKITVPITNATGKITNLKAFLVASLSDPTPLGNALSFLP